MTNKAELKELIEELRKEIKGLGEEVVTLQNMVMLITPKNDRSSPAITPMYPLTPSRDHPFYPNITYSDSAGKR